MHIINSVVFGREIWWRKEFKMSQIWLFKGLGGHIFWIKIYASNLVKNAHFQDGCHNFQNRSTLLVFKKEENSSSFGNSSFSYKIYAGIFIISNQWDFSNFSFYAYWKWIKRKKLLKKSQNNKNSFQNFTAPIMGIIQGFYNSEC